MFYYKVIKDGSVVGYLETEDVKDVSGFLAIDEEEYNAVIAQLQEESRKELEENLTVQDIVVQEQANLLTLRGNSTLSAEDSAYIDNRLNAISDYWDSKEGEVATYAE